MQFMKRKKKHTCVMIVIQDLQERQTCVMQMPFSSIHERKRPHKCSMCSANFARKQELNKHIEVLHSSQKKQEKGIVI